MTKVDTISGQPVHVMDYLKRHDFLELGLNGKVHCKLTNRDIPLRVDAIEQHLASKKLKKEKEWYKADYSKYEPWIVPHKSNPKLLFCRLTQIDLNRIPSQVEAHANGKRFQNRKREAEETNFRLKSKPAEAESESKEGDVPFWVPGKTDVDEIGSEADEKQAPNQDDDDDELDEGAKDNMSKVQTDKRLGPGDIGKKKKHVQRRKALGKPKVTTSDQSRKGEAIGPSKPEIRADKRIEISEARSKGAAAKTQKKSITSTSKKPTTSASTATRDSEGQGRVESKGNGTGQGKSGRSSAGGQAGAMGTPSRKHIQGEKTPTSRSNKKRRRV